MRCIKSGCPSGEILARLCAVPSMTTPLGGAVLPGGIDERPLIPCRCCLPLHEAGVMFEAPLVVHLSAPYSSWWAPPLVVGCCCGLKSSLHWRLCFIALLVGSEKINCWVVLSPLPPFPFKDYSPWMAPYDGTWTRMLWRCSH
jgi:hypothetical protein